MRAGAEPRLYRAWTAMRDRCHRAKSAFYRCYGGRGITICKRWDSYTAFAADMGPHPGKGWSLDRKRNNNSYCQSNCRWATPIMQGRNRRTTKLTPEKVAQMRALDAHKIVIAKQFNVHLSHVYRILNRTHW